MKWADIEWSMLGGAVLALVVSLALAASLVQGTGYFRERMDARAQQSQQRARDISARYLAVDEEELIIKEQYPRFIELYRRGVIGQEQRLTWVEVLRQAGEKIKLPELRYEIATREVYQPDFELPGGGFQVNASTMKLHLGLLHEVDLFALLREVDQRAAGLYSVKECVLRRVGDDPIDTQTVGKNVEADCELLWYTLQLSNGQDIVL
ncbi:MAG: hypothetical protein ACREWG_02555 [Gammaproteobacteria bacterium]